MIKYFATKKAAVDHLKATGWQSEPELRGSWFRYPRPGECSKMAYVGRASKVKGLWAVNYND